MYWSHYVTFIDIYFIHNLAYYINLSICLGFHVLDEGRLVGWLQEYFYRGGGEVEGSLNFCNPKRIQIQTILDIFKTFFGMFCEISGPLSHAAYRKVLNCGHFN